MKVFKRLFDLMLGCILCLIFAVPMILVTVAVHLTSKGRTLYWSDRVGKNNKIFQMPKFRTMLIDTPIVATHLLDDPDVYLTPIGGFLRKTSLDELPQLFSVIKGEMSLVGPRPALFNQNDLILLRGSIGIDRLLPGVTGWAQVNGRDELSIDEKVALDEVYMQKASILFDMRILWMTLLRVVNRDGVTH